MASSFNLYDDLEQMESMKLEDKPTGKELEVSILLFLDFCQKMFVINHYFLKCHLILSYFIIL